MIHFSRSFLEGCGPKNSTEVNQQTEIVKVTDTKWCSGVGYNSPQIKPNQRTGLKIEKTAKRGRDQSQGRYWKQQIPNSIDQTE